MRLFIALNFSDEVKKQILGIIERVRLGSVCGGFVREEHMHLTVEFLGEVQPNKLGLIKEIMDGLNFKPFTLTLTKIGYFRRSEGNIYWLGVEKNETLFGLQKELHKSLMDRGFELEDREYRTHITLGRRVVLSKGFDTNELNDMAGKIKIDIDKVDLMKSEFINGRLIHSLIYSKPLQ